MDSVLIEPVANRSHSTLIGVGRWVRSVENPNLPKQHNSNTAACPLTDLATELQEKSLDIPPGQAATDGTREDQLKGALVLPLHWPMVLGVGTRGVSNPKGFKPPAQYQRLHSQQPKPQPAAADGSKRRIQPTHR